MSLEDYRTAARVSLPGGVFDYIDGSAGDEITDRANRHDFDHLSLLPLCLRDVSAPTLTTNLLGRTCRVPIGFSPTAFHQLVGAEHNGELGATAHQPEFAVGAGNTRGIDLLPRNHVVLLA